MFEVGKAYNVTMYDQEGDQTHYDGWFVVKIDYPVVTFGSANFKGNGQRIINVGSLAFVSAELAT